MYLYLRGVLRVLEYIYASFVISSVRVSILTKFLCRKNSFAPARCFLFVCMHAVFLELDEMDG